MLTQAGGFLLLALCVGYSYQICHNGICHKPMCHQDNDCHASCYMCNTTCLTCDRIPNCCTSHVTCDNHDGICDTLDAHPNTCNYCAIDHQCKPGCIDNKNCPAGSQCINHQCKPVDSCTEDAYCNGGHTTGVICDIENFPYTTCKYCEGGECKPGCVTDSNCPPIYPTCSEHECKATGGVVRVDSITIRSKQGCTDCNKEGVSVELRGEKTPAYPQGFPCATMFMDHESPNDYNGAAPVKFNGKISGAFNQKERDMMGGCYKGGLNSYLNDGGTLTWRGAVGWEPQDVCVEFEGNHYAWECLAAKETKETKKWNLRDCHNLTPHTTCDRTVRTRTSGQGPPNY